MKTDKVVVAVEFSSQLPELLEPLKSMNFLVHSQIHFVYVFTTMTASFGLTEFPVSYPDQRDLAKIKEDGLSLMAPITQMSVPLNFDGKITNKILFSEDPKGTFTEYVNENKADLVIIFSRKKHGVFESSFAQYVNKHTGSDLIFLKHKT